MTGPDGVVVYEVMGGDPWVWYADPEGFAALKQERGIKQLPNPMATKKGEEDKGSIATYDETGMLIAPIVPRPTRKYPEPRFCHSGDLEWIEVQAQERDGTRRVGVGEVAGVQPAGDVHRDPARSRAGHPGPRAATASRRSSCSRAR